MDELDQKDHPKHDEKNCTYVLMQHDFLETVLTDHSLQHRFNQTNVSTYVRTPYPNAHTKLAWSRLENAVTFQKQMKHVSAMSHTQATSQAIFDVKTWSLEDLSELEHFCDLRT